MSESYATPGYITPNLCNITGTTKITNIVFGAGLSMTPTYIFTPSGLAKVSSNDKAIDVIFDQSESLTIELERKIALDLAFQILKNIGLNPTLDEAIENLLILARLSQ